MQGSRFLDTEDVRCVVSGDANSSAAGVDICGERFEVLESSFPTATELFSFLKKPRSDGLA